MKNQKAKIVVITGPTATGKSSLSIEIAQLFNGEIISADSRQVYRGLDIGSAKITKSEMQDTPHHLIDIADPSDIFTVDEFKKLADQKIAGIHKRGKLPIICGGTGMYISAVIDNMEFPEVAPDFALREVLEQLSTAELFAKLQTLDPKRSETIDKDNKVRLVRAIEIANTLGAVPELKKEESPYDTLIIGLKVPKEELDERIAKRINARIPALFEEIRGLHARGISSDRLRKLGLEYRYGNDYVLGDIMLPEFIETLAIKTSQFVRRQMTWWKRDPRIVWLNPLDDHQKILQLVQDFLK